MRAIKLCVIILITAVVINFLRDDRSFHISKVLPFAGGRESISIYDWASVAALAICAWGLYRLKRNQDEDD
jgi:hypothetical protein